MLTEWLRDHVAGETDGEIESMIERFETRYRELAIEPPTTDGVGRELPALDLSFHLHPSADAP
jgi:hypothetical protein